MQLMGLDKSGKCPICMETDSLDHLAFACHYSAANHRRQEWVASTESAINRLTKESQKRPRWLGAARDTLLRERKEMYMRHPSKLLLWKDSWPQSLREHLELRCQGIGGGRSWATDTLRKLLTQTVHFFTQMAFATLLDLNGIRYKTVVQLTMTLACKPP